MHRTDVKDDQPVASVVADDEASILRVAIESARRGESSIARRLLQSVCESNPNSEMAWLWRASLATNATEGLEYLTQVLRVNPANATALDWLHKLRTRASIGMGRKRLALPTSNVATTTPPVSEAEADKAAKQERAEFAARFAEAEHTESSQVATQQMTHSVERLSAALTAELVAPEETQFRSEADQIAEARRLATLRRITEARRIAEFRRLSEADPAIEAREREAAKRREDAARIDEARRFAEARRTAVSRRVAEAREIEECQRRSIRERLQADARWEAEEEQRVLRAVEQLISEPPPEVEVETEAEAEVETEAKVEEVVPDVVPTDVAPPDVVPAEIVPEVEIVQALARVVIASTALDAQCPLCLSDLAEAANRCKKCKAIIGPLNLTDFALNNKLNRESVLESIERLTRLEDSVYAQAALTLANLNLLRYAKAIEHLRALVRLDAMHPLVQNGNLLRQLAQPIVMVVDDSSTIREVIVTAIGANGYTPLPIANPWEVIPTMLDERPSLVLLDISMPMMDGYEVCRAIRKNKVISQTAVVMLSGHDGFMDKMKGKIAGASEYLTKPIETPQLLTTLQRRVRRVGK